MKKLLLPLLLFLTSAHSFHRNLAISYLSSDCVTCLSDNSKRWCVIKNPGYLSWGDGECCANGDTTGYCSTDTDYFCTDDANIHDSGKKLLCPIENDKCGNSSMDMKDNGIYTEFRKSGIPNGSVCIYSTSWYYEDGNFHIRADSIDGNITVFVDNDQDWDKFSASLIGYLVQGDTLTVPVKMRSHIHLLVEPTAATASFNITYHSEYSKDQNIDVTVGIIAGGVYIGGLAVLCIFFTICWCVKSVARGDIKNSAKINYTRGDQSLSLGYPRFQNNIYDGSQLPVNGPINNQIAQCSGYMVPVQPQNPQPSMNRVAPS